MRKYKGYLATIIIGAGFAAATAAFFYHQRGFRDQVLFNLQQAAHVLLFGALAWAAYFAGRLATRYLFRREESYWEVDVALGWILFGAAAFVLATTGLVYVWAVRIIVLAIFALSVPTLWRLLRAAPDHVSASTPRLTPGVILLALAAVPFAVSAASCAGQPPVEWDVVVYHLYLPQQFLARHGFFYMPRFAYASMPLGAEMMYTWAYAWDGLGVAAAVAPFFHGLMLVAVWRLARRFVDNFWATAAAAILLFTPTFGALFESAYTDFVLATFVVMAFVVYERGLERGRDAALAGVLLGAALAVKYTAVHALFGFASLLVLDLARRRLRFRNATVFIFAAFAAVAPWLVKAFIERGNPVFPALYGVFGGRDLSPKAAEGIVRSMREIGMGREALDYLLLPYRVSAEGGSGYRAFAGSLWPFSFLVIPFAWAWFRKWRLILFSIFNFASWAFIGSQQLRFLGGFFGTLAVLNVGVLEAAVGSFRGVGRKVATCITIGAVVALGYFLGLGHMGDWSQRFLDYQTERKEGFLLKWARCYPAHKFVNENLPEGAVLISVFDNTRLYLEREAICDPFCDASEIIYAVEKSKNVEEVAAYIDGFGATHLMTNKTAAGYFWSYYEREAKGLWEAYLRRHTTVIYDDGAYEVRAIN